MRGSSQDVFASWEEVLKDSGINFVDIKAADLVGRWRHITVPASEPSEELLRRGIGFDGSSYGYSAVENSDMLLVPDIETARREPASDGEVLSVIGEVFQVEGGEKRVPFPHGPRRTARRAMNYLESSGVADDFLISPEFEFYLFESARFSYDTNHGEFRLASPELMEGKQNQESPTSSHPLVGSEGYHAPSPRDSVMELRNEIVSFLKQEKIPVKYHHHELGGAGESEIEVDFTDLLSGCDNALYTKHSVREIAREKGKSATFMPKPIDNFPANGMHVHQYLVKDGENLFSGEEYAGLSQLALYFVGGLLEHGKSLMGLTNPTTNSYRRLIPGHEAPVDLVFAKSNRSAAIRIPGYIQTEDENRIELRTIDGSCNPYLAFSAVLMAGLDGIEKQIDPSKRGYGPIEENIYELPEKRRAELKSAPTSLETALKALEEDHDYLMQGGVFKEQQVKNWLNVKRKEVSVFHDKPHPYEHVLYYDL